MSFSDFLAEHRLTLLGLYMLQERGLEAAALASQLPLGSLDGTDLETLVEDLESAMPIEGMIADLKNSDLRLYDLLADDWFFGAAFGPESLVESHANDLAQVFLEQCERLALDYDQHSSPEAFSALIHEEAHRFVSAWRERIAKPYTSQRPSAA